MIFKKKTNKLPQESNGLYASLEDLFEQKKYLPYIRQKHLQTTSDQVGNIRSAFKGRGIEFEEVRSYGFGDDVRDIDWRVTARLGNTYTKVFSEEKDREVYVVLDLSPYMVFATKKELKSVSASKITALLGWLSLSNKDRFGIILYDGIKTKVFKSQSSQKNLMAILKAISTTSKQILDYPQNIKANINTSLQLLQHNIKSKAVVFIVSDFKNTSEEALKTIVTLTKKCSIYCINVYDYIEEIAPQNGEYFVEYDKEKLSFNTSSSTYKEVYSQYFANKRKSKEDFFKKFKCQYINIRTDKDLHKQLKVI